jgi:hypothetical protein
LPASSLLYLRHETFTLSSQACAASKLRAVNTCLNANPIERVVDPPESREDAPFGGPIVQQCLNSMAACAIDFAFRNFMKVDP